VFKFYFENIVSVSSTPLREKGMIRIRIKEVQKHVDPADPDPDPQHSFYRCMVMVMLALKQYGI